MGPAFLGVVAQPDPILMYLKKIKNKNKNIKNINFK
jgi:hypothetical protein